MNLIEATDRLREAKAILKEVHLPADERIEAFETILVHTSEESGLTIDQLRVALEGH